MIEPKVAVDKLNSMTIEEILYEAASLKCDHIPKDNLNCIVANILSHWTEEHVSVTRKGVFFSSVLERDTAMDPRNVTFRLAGHVTVLIDWFDRL